MKTRLPLTQNLIWSVSAQNTNPKQSNLNISFGRYDNEGFSFFCWVFFFFFLKNGVLKLILPTWKILEICIFKTYVYIYIHIKGKPNTVLQAEQAVAFSLKWIFDFWIFFVSFLNSVWPGNLKNPNYSYGFNYLRCLPEHLAT